MTLYFLFAFETYYPGGGFDDLVGIYTTFEEAAAAAHEPIPNSLPPVERDNIVIEAVKDGEHVGRWVADKRWHGPSIREPNPGAWVIREWERKDTDGWL